MGGKPCAVNSGYYGERLRPPSVAFWVLLCRRDLIARPVCSSVFLLIKRFMFRSGYLLPGVEGETLDDWRCYGKGPHSSCCICVCLREGGNGRTPRGQNQYNQTYSTNMVGNA